MVEAKSFRIVFIQIQHTMNGVQYHTIYGHLSTIAVHTGQIVHKGQVIGSSGGNGNSTGPHLHFQVEIYMNNVYKVIDPYGWQPIQGAYTTNDPWAQNINGTISWCMWDDGNWSNKCPGGAKNIAQPPEHSIAYLVDDNENTNNFTKGFGGLYQNNCLGNDPTCQEWWIINGMGVDGESHRTMVLSQTGQNGSLLSKAASPYGTKSMFISLL